MAAKRWGGGARNATRPPAIGKLLERRSAVFFSFFFSQKPLGPRRVLGFGRAVRLCSCQGPTDAMEPCALSPVFLITEELIKDYLSIAAHRCAFPESRYPSLTPNPPHPRPKKKQQENKNKKQKKPIFRAESITKVYFPPFLKNPPLPSKIQNIQSPLSLQKKKKENTQARVLGGTAVLVGPFTPLR